MGHLEYPAPVPRAGIRDRAPEDHPKKQEIGYKNLSFKTNVSCLPKTGPASNRLPPRISQPDPQLKLLDQGYKRFSISRGITNWNKAWNLPGHPRTKPSKNLLA